MNLKPLLCSACDKHLGHIDECDNQSDFYCDDCAALFTAIEPAVMASIKNHAEELILDQDGKPVEVGRIEEISKEELQRRYPYGRT